MFLGYYDSLFTSGIDTRMGAQVLVESSVFHNTTKDIGWYESKTTGYAVVKDVDLGTGTSTAPAGTLNSVPYSYTVLGSKAVQAAVVGKAGNTLKF